MTRRRWLGPLVLLVALLLLPAAAVAQPSQLEMNVEGVGRVSAPLQVVLVLTLLTFVPALLVTMTSFTRIVIVFHFLRQAIGSQEAPPNQVLIGLALFLTMFIMAPVGERIHADAVQPVIDGQLSVADALGRAAPPLREFMLRQTREKDLALFLGISGRPRPETPADVPPEVVVPAFMISELKTAFTISFMIYIPFLVLDMVVASILTSMGMITLPPVLISLPFKLMIFVLVDGWNLLISSLVRSFQ